jgi:hypothetical protein
MPDISIPDKYTITLKDADFLDVRMSGNASQPIALAPMSAELTGDPDAPIATLLTGDKDKPITTLLTGDPDQPIATTFELLNIPRLSLADIKDLLTPKLRIEMPNYEQLCFKLFGVEIFSFCLSGEFQTITQGYQPNRFERCEIECPDLDTRPFPSDTGTHDRG